MYCVGDRHTQTRGRTDGRQPRRIMCSISGLPSAVSVSLASPQGKVTVVPSAPSARWGPSNGAAGLKPHQTQVGVPHTHTQREIHPALGVYLPTCLGGLAVLHAPHCPGQSPMPSWHTRRTHTRTRRRAAAFCERERMAWQVSQSVVPSGLCRSARVPPPGRSRMHNKCRL